MVPGASVANAFVMGSGDSSVPRLVPVWKNGGCCESWRAIVEYDPVL